MSDLDLLDRYIAIFTASDIDHTVEPEKHAAFFNAGGDDWEATCSVQVNDLQAPGDDNSLALCEIDVPVFEAPFHPDRRPAVYELMAIVNAQLEFGHFQAHPATYELRFHISTLLPLGRELSDIELMAPVMAAIEGVEHYRGLLAAVMDGADPLHVVADDLLDEMASTQRRPDVEEAQYIVRLLGEATMRAEGDTEAEAAVAASLARLELPEGFESSSD